MKVTFLNDLPSEGVSHNPAIQKKVMLRPGELPNLVYFSRAQLPAGECAGAHSHQDMCEVFFVESGLGTIRIDGTDYPLQQGTCAVVEPGEVHEVINTGSTELILTYFALKVGL